MTLRTVSFYVNKRAEKNRAVIQICGAFLLTTTLLFSSTNALAGDGGGYKKEGRRGPPPEAIDACAGLEAEAACGFVTPRGHEISGSCFVPPHEGAELACKPTHGKKHRKGKYRSPEGEAGDAAAEDQG